MGDLGRDDPRWTPAASTPLTIEITIYGWSTRCGTQLPCLSRQVEGDELLTAIRVVGSGRSYVSAPAGCLLEKSPNFTGREQDILRLVVNGATDKEIAEKLCISKHTVQSHLDRIGEKTRVPAPLRPYSTRDQIRAHKLGIEPPYAVAVGSSAPSLVGSCSP
jgi:hypothetical protein